MRIKRIEGIWAVFSGSELLECYDTKADANDAMPTFREAILSEIDKTHKWQNVLDYEKELMRDGEMGTGRSA